MSLPVSNFLTRLFHSVSEMRLAGRCIVLCLCRHLPSRLLFHGGQSRYSHCSIKVHLWAVIYIHRYKYAFEENCTRSSPHSQGPHQAPKHGVEVMALPNEVIGSNTAMFDLVFLEGSQSTVSANLFVNILRKQGPRDAKVV